MRKTIRGALLCSALLALGSEGLSAAEITLKDWALNISGTLYGPAFDPALPASVNSSAFDFGTGLGSLQVRISGTGPHFVGWFLDHDIDESTNLWFNETGTAVGIPDPRQTWEIDEPGYGMDGGRGPYVGDVLYNNLIDSGASGSLLDNLVFSSFWRCNPAVGGDIGFCDDPSDFEETTERKTLSDYGRDRDDVSMALGWLFELLDDEIAIIDLRAGLTDPTGFHLAQTDPDSDATLYLSGALTVRAVPVPATVTLMAMGLVIFGADIGRQVRRRRPA